MAEATITDNSKFIKLVKDGNINPSLKSYADTLLFYYIGYIAASNNSGDLLEIGVGGSTYPLVELSEVCSKILNLVDAHRDHLNYRSSSKFFNNTNIKSYNINSQELPSNKEIKNLIYSHIDGSKDFRITVNDLKYCLSNMAVNGIICQDDYGNNKWPTVTDAVQTLINSGELKLVIVGDSSAWLTKPEYYDYWINILTKDKEFNTLSKLLNVTSSLDLHKLPVYFYMNACVKLTTMSDLTEYEIKYCNTLLDAETKNYLQMPYTEQSTPGYHLRVRVGYTITKIWNDIKKSSWPFDAPRSKEDIDNLPQWVKEEITEMRKLDLYSTCNFIDNHINTKGVLNEHNS